jgi:hypothetical protein
LVRTCNLPLGRSTPPPTTTTTTTTTPYTHACTHTSLPPVPPGLYQ